MASIKIYKNIQKVFLYTNIYKYTKIHNKIRQKIYKIVIYQQYKRSETEFYLWTENFKLI